MRATLAASPSAPTVVALCTAALLLASPRAFALDPSLDLQQYGHLSWQAQEGFFNSTIRAAAQTPDGYLWLGTDGGLVRFDGVRTVPWMPPSGQRLPSTVVFALLAARDGTLWIGTLQGLASWRDGQLTHHAALAGQQVTDLLEDSTGTVWAGTAGQPTARLCAFLGGSVTCFGEDGLLGDLVWALAADHAGTLWVLARSGLWRWTGQPSRHGSERFEEYFQHLGPAPGPNGVTHAHGGTVRDIVPGNRSSEPVPGLPSGINITRVFRDRDGGLWIGTDAHGLLRVHGERVSAFTSVNGLSGDHVTAFFEDREGTIWVATADGLDSFRHLPIVPFGLTDTSVTRQSPISIVGTRDGSLWIGSDNGLHRWRGGRATIYRTRTHPGLPDDHIQSLAEDERGRLWVTGIRGVAVFENGAFTPVPTPRLGYVFAVTSDGRGGAWVSSWDQGVLHLAGGEVVQQLSWQDLGGNGVGSGLAADVDGGVWIATTGGSLILVRDGRIQRTLTPEDGLGHPLLNVQADADGAIWATSEMGFTRILDERLATLSAANGLPCNEGHWIVADDAGAYWLFMRCGLVRMARTEMEAWLADSQRRVETTTFGPFDGVRLFAYNRLERPQVARLADGRIWFVLPGTLATLHPALLHTNPIPPPVHVEHVTADERHSTYAVRCGCHRTSEISASITPRSAWRRPGRSASAFSSRGRTRTGERSPTNARCTIRTSRQATTAFASLPPNNSGVWSEEGDVVEFSIAPAYYQTAAFRVLSAVLVAGLLGGVWRLRLRTVSRRLEMTLEARAAERTRIARDLHDTLLQDFQGLLLMFEAALKLLPERPAEARGRLQRALDHAMNATSEARSAVQGLRSPDVDNDLVRSLTKIADEVTGADHPAVHVGTSGTALPLKPIVRGEVYRVVAEALRNALRHSEAREITVAIRYDPREFRVQVRDDGKGIDEPGDPTQAARRTLRPGGDARARRTRGGTADPVEQGRRGHAARAEHPCRRRVRRASSAIADFPIPGVGAHAGRR